MSGFVRRVWPWLSIAAGVAGAIFLDPAAPDASWWPSAAWAQHAVTGFLVGIGVVIIGAVLGLVTGSISVPGISIANDTQVSSAGELDEIRQKIAEMGAEQKALNETATQALTLARTAMEELLTRGREG
jgi:hypothetical protein